MARRSSRQSIAVNTPTSTTHKRQASSSAATPASAPSKKRARTSAAATVPATQKRKSKADQRVPISAEEQSDPSEDDNSAFSDNSTSEDGQGSDFEDEDAVADSPSEEDEPSLDEEESDDSSAPGNRRRKSKSNARNVKTTLVKNNPRGKSQTNKGTDSKSTIIAGGRIVTKRPKARDPGDTPYVSETVHPNTLEFLRDLEENNNREWLKGNDPDYRTSLQDWSTFCEELTPKIIEADETIPELPVKDVIFRVYRDVRFSSDKRPYKPYFSVGFSRTGRKGPYAIYYIQIKPGGSLIAGGIWCPDASDLALLRAAIDQRPQDFKRTLADARIRKEFLGGVGSDEKKIVKKFVDSNAEMALKTKPKGFEADHKDIALLRLRNFILRKQLGDDEVVGTAGRDLIAHLVSCLEPWVTFLNSIVRPDQDSSNEDNDDDDNDGSQSQNGSDDTGRQGPNQDDDDDDDDDDADDNGSRSDDEDEE